MCFVQGKINIPSCVMFAALIEKTSMKRPLYFTSPLIVCISFISLYSSLSQVVIRGPGMMFQADVVNRCSHENLRQPFKAGIRQTVSVFVRTEMME